MAEDFPHWPPVLVADVEPKFLIHNWIYIEPRGQKCVSVPQRKVTGGRPRPFAKDTHRVDLWQRYPVWVLVTGWECDPVTPSRYYAIIVAVDHGDHSMRPGYEYQIPANKVHILSSKRPLHD